MHKLLPFVLAIVVLHSCKEETDPTSIDLGYDYFPNKLGTYIIYQVDSIGLGIEDDTASYQVKEVLTEEFVDGANQLAMRVERFKRFSENDAWVLSDIWTQKRTSSAAMRTEEDVT
jgi:hypothetical protein